MPTCLRFSLTSLPILVATLFMAVSGSHAAGGNDALSASIVDSNPFVDSDTTVGKGDDGSIPSCRSGGADNAEDAWYRIDLVSEADLSTWLTCASSGPASYDTRLGLFDAGLNLLYCNDDAANCGSPWLQSAIENVLLPAGTYYIVVDGFDGASGPYQLNVSWTPTIGGCATGSDRSNADPVLTLPFSSSATTVDACHNFTLDCELGGGTTAPDYWYHVSLDTTVLVDIWTDCDSTALDTRIAVVDTNLTQIYCNDNDSTCTTGQSRIASRFLDAGEYFVIVEGPDAVGGPFTIHMDTTVVDPSANPEWLPDIVVRESDLYDHDVVTNIVPGRTHLRLSNGTANLGDGKFYIYGTGVDNGDGTENILQRVYLENGAYYDRPAGNFVFHPQHDHIHVEGWSTYRLRQVLPGDGVGAEVAKGEKTSFCILDLGIEDSSLPNFSPTGEFFSCASTVQGLSVGWVDVYSKGLPDQNIDVTNVPDGTYWLESEVDPNNWFREKDETNNVTRIKVTLGNGPAINPDPYEPNPDAAAVLARPVGGVNSPQLGPCNPQRVLTQLTLNVAGDEDWFSFYANDTGAAGDFVSVSFDSSAANLDIALVDSAGAVVDSSFATGAGTEVISLDGRPEGWYFVRVFSPNADTIADYTLVVDPPANAAPVVTPGEPATGTQYILHGVETFTVTWTSSDPEGDARWVTVYANTAPQFDGNEVLLPTSLHTPANQGFYVVNSAYLVPATYWFYFEITDGGTTTGAWSNGNLMVHEGTTAAPEVDLARTALLPSYPNPFNPRTTLRLNLARAQHVRWNLYDVRGALVKRLADQELSAGLHEIVWDGTDQHGRRVVSGVYFQHVVTLDLRQSQKLLLLK